SSAWSCLAAHAAVLHLDGILRQRLDDKRFGIFQYIQAATHDLTAGVPARVGTPHSRWNDLPERELRSCGYSILTRSDATGVDTFVKQKKSLFVFFQGHPEYEADTLLLEYRRDIKRYLGGESDRYPSQPNGYFNADLGPAFDAFRERATAERSLKALEDF